MQCKNLFCWKSFTVKNSRLFTIERNDKTCEENYRIITAHLCSFHLIVFPKTCVHLKQMTKSFYWKTFFSNPMFVWFCCRQPMVRLGIYYDIFHISCFHYVDHKNYLRFEPYKFRIVSERTKCEMNRTRSKMWKIQGEPWIMQLILFHTKTFNPSYFCNLLII